MARRLDEIDAELLELRRAAKLEHTKAREWCLKEKFRRACLVIFDQAGGNTEPCAVYLEMVGRYCRWAPKENAELRTMAEDIFLDAVATEDGVQAYAALADLSNPSDPSAVREALSYSEEWHVVEWAREQNMRKRVAPSTDELLRHLEARRIGLPETVRPPPRGTSLDPRARKWATRLRERWGGFVGQFKQRVDLPLAEKRDKASATWQWWSHLRSRVPPGSSILRVNLDETAIAVHPGSTNGSIFVSKRKLQELVEDVPMNKKRCYMTHIALICDRTDIQPRLPQVLVANEHTFRVRDMATLRAACPPNVHLVRQKSAWNNQWLCAEVIRLLKEAVTPHVGGARIVLLLDVSRVHLTDAVLNACRRHGVWPLFVPASLTWLLQPLDTHAFAIFKWALRMAYHRARGEDANGNVSLPRMLKCFYDTIRAVLQGRRWSAAFDSNGFGVTALSPRVALALELDANITPPCTRPTDDQLRMCFPRRARIPAVWRPIDAPPPAPRIWGRPARGRGRAAAAAPAVLADGPAVGAIARGRGHGPSRTRSGRVYRAG